jgi:hypothetical protein
MKGSGGSENLTGAAGEALRTTHGVRNGCGDNCPMLGTPFIRWRCCVVAHLGIKSIGVVPAPASMRFHSLRLPVVAEYKRWSVESSGSSWWEGEARRPCCHGGQETALDLLNTGTLIDYHFMNEQMTEEEEKTAAYMAT